MTDEISVLVKNAQNGDTQAFGSLYSLFLRKIYRFVYFMVESETLAEDIAQNTFVKAWKALPVFSQKKGTFQAYLFSIARNLVMDHFRQKKTISVDLDFVTNIESSENIEEQTINGEEKQQVKQAINKLDDKEKQMIILRYFEELPMGDIAKTFTMEEGAVRVRIFRILRKLKEILGGKI